MKEVFIISFNNAMKGHLIKLRQTYKLGYICVSLVIWHENLGRMLTLIFRVQFTVDLHNNQTNMDSG